MEFVVIFDDGDKLIVSKDIEYHNKTTMKYDAIFIQVKGIKVDMHFDVTDYTRENSVIYVPKKLHYMFEGESIVNVTLIDPRTIQDITIIHVVPISDKFYRGCSQPNLVKYMQGAKIMTNNTLVPELFQIKGLFSVNGERLEYGMTCNVPFKVEVLEVNNANPLTPWYTKQKTRVPVAPQKKAPTQNPEKVSKIDFSPVKTEIYKKMFIKNGEIVYIK